MTRTVEAVFEHGVFRPLQTIDLAESQRVLLSFAPAEDDALDPAEFDRLALSSLAEVWDNDEDAIYDNWRELYGVTEG